MKNTLFILLVFSTLNLLGQTSNPEAYKSLRESHLKSDFTLYYNPLMDTYDIYFVELDIEVSDLSTYVSGNVTIHARATQELDTLLIDLKSNMILDSMLVNNKKINATRINDQIQYIFDTPLVIGENFDTQIFYRGTPTGGGVTNSYSSTWQKNVTWTLSESYHAYEWWPCKQVLSDKIDSTYIFLTCDDDCMAGSNGLLTNVVDLPNNKKRFEWKTNYPIDQYLISFAVAEYEDYSIYAYPANSDPILIQNFIYNSTGCLENYKTEIDETVNFIELFSEKFGLYPFAKEKYGHCLTQLGGGMEHQTMTTIGNFGYTLVAHELGHMWFGDYVTCATWQDIWINEGFASYTTYVALENLQAGSYAQDWMNSAHRTALTEPDKSMYIPFSEVFSERRIFNYALSYQKGPAIIHMIRHEINNDDLFFAAIQNYLFEYGDSVATGEDFKNSIKNYTGIDFDPFFEQWYYGKGSPTFNVGYAQSNDTLSMTVSQTTSSSTPLFQMFVDYKIYYSGGDTTVRYFQSNNQETFKIPIRETVTNIAVDPDNWILKTIGTVDSIELPGSNKSLFNFSPNPVKETISINFNVRLYNNEKQIQIMDINGRLIRSYTTNSNSYPIDLSFLSNGIYFIRGISANKSYTYKFVKQ
jgi:aminopeptidase N